MIFLLSAAALGIGGMVGFLAYEKGRSPLGWGVYGALLAPIALPHVLLTSRREPPVEATAQSPQENQSVNPPAPTVRRGDALRAEPFARPGTAPKPLVAERNELPKSEPSIDRTIPRAEPTLERHVANDDAGHVRAPRDSDFTVAPGERIGAPHGHSGDARGRPGEDRMRAPLSVDPTERAPSRIKVMPFVAGAAALLIAGGVSAFWLNDMLPPGWRWTGSTATREVPPAGLTPPPGAAADTQPGANGAPAGEQAMAQPSAIDPDAKEVGTAQLAKPIPSRPDTAKTASRDPSPAKETNLALATRGMKAAESPTAETAKAGPTRSEPATTERAKADPPKPEAPKTAAPSAVKPTPAPKSDVKSDKTGAKSKTKAATSSNKPVLKPAAQPAPEDFLAMVNRALGTPNGAAAGTEDEAAATGEMVQTIQTKLRERGFDPGSIDGRAGAKTTQAIRDFQQSVGMAPTGRIDMALMEKLGIVGKRLQFPGR